MILSNDCYLPYTCKKFDQGNCPQDGFCIKLFKTDYYLSEALLSPVQKKHSEIKLDIDGTDRQEFLLLKEFELNIEKNIIEGKNLYIFSPITGNGKTLWAIRLLQSYINNIWYKSDLHCKALYINIPRFLLSLKESISSPNEYIDHIKSNVIDVDLVVWDEVGSKCATEYEKDHLLNFINTRLDRGKANIYTSNITPQDLAGVVGNRLSSRIINLSKVVEFKGKDKRGI